MRLMAALTGFDFDVMNGVKGGEIPAKALHGISNRGVPFYSAIY